MERNLLNEWINVIERFVAQYRKITLIIDCPVCPTIDGLYVIELIFLGVIHLWPPQKMTNFLTPPTPTICKNEQ